MILQCSNHGENEFFGKNRLIFRGPSKRPEGEARGGETRKETPRERLKRLTEEIGKKQKKSPKRKPPQKRAHWTDFEERPLPDPKLQREIERASQLEGLMSKEEIRNMNRAHFVVSHHYMNPAFMLYANSREGVKKGISSQEIYGAFDVILSHPYDFQYQYDKAAKIMTISKRRDAGTSVPDVSVTVQVKDKMGNEIVTHINGKSLKNPDNTFPWEGIDYQKKVADHEKFLFDQWYNVMYAPELYPDTPWEKMEPAERQQKYAEARGKVLAKWNKEGIKEAFMRVSDSFKDAFVHNQVTIPYRLIGLIKARSAADPEAYKFENSDNPAFQALLTQEAYLKKLHEMESSKAYEKMVGDIENLPVVVKTMPEFPDAYVIYISQTDSTLVVHKNGYLLHENVEGKWVPYEEYELNLESGYYEKHKDRNAEALIAGEAFASEQEKLKTSQAERKKLEENRAYMKPVLGVLTNATWEQYTAIVLALSPEAERAEMKSTLEGYVPVFKHYGDNYKKQVMGSLRTQLMTRMIDDKENTRTIAGILGVALSDATSESGAETPEEEGNG